VQAASLGSQKNEKKRKENFVHLFFIRSASSPFPGSATGRRRTRSMRSSRPPHSVHGLSRCVCTRDAGAIAIVRPKFVFWGALLPGQKEATLFSRFFFGIFSPFHPTRTILREFWTFRRPWERGPSLHDLPFSFFLFPPFSSLWGPARAPTPPGGQKGER